MIVRELLASFGLKIDAASFKKGDDAVEASKRRLESIKKVSDGVTKAVKVMAVAGAAALVTLGVAAAKVGGEFESMRASLKTVTGSADAAAAAFKNIQKFAASTPFSVKEITAAFIKLKALGLDPSERALKSYGNTSSAMGKSLNEMIEAVADASTGEFERLKEFGIKSKSEGDKVSFTFQGVTTTVAKNAEEIQKYLLAIGETKFAGAMDEQAKTFSGVMSNLGDALDSFLDEVAQNGLLDALKEVGREIAGMTAGGGNLAKMLGGALGKAVRMIWSEGKKLIPVFGQVLDMLPQLVKFFGQLLGVAGTVVGGIVKFTDAVGGVGNAITLLLPALAAMKVATIAAAGPWGVLAAAMLAAIPIAMEVGDAIGVAMSNAVNDIDNMTKRLHGKQTRKRGQVDYLGLREGEAGYEFTKQQVSEMDDDELERVGYDMSLNSPASADAKALARAEWTRRRGEKLEVTKANIDVEYASKGFNDAHAQVMPMAKRAELSRLARMKRQGRNLSPSEKKRFTALQKELDTTPNTKRPGKSKVDFDRDGYERAVDAYKSMGLEIPKSLRAAYMDKKEKGKHLTAQEQLEHDFGGGRGVAAGGKIVDRPGLGTTINRIENRYDPKVSVTVQAAQRAGEDGDAFAQRVVELTQKTIERVVLRPGFDHFTGISGA